MCPGLATNLRVLSRNPEGPDLPSCASRPLPLIDVSAGGGGLDCDLIRHLRNEAPNCGG